MAEETVTKCLACGQADYRILADTIDQKGRAALESVLGLRPHGARRIVAEVCPACGHVNIFLNPKE